MSPAISSPDSAILLITIPNPTVTSGGVSSPTSAILQIVVPGPATTSGGVSSPGSVIELITIPGPTTTAGAVSSPTSAILQIFVPNPSVSTNSQIADPFRTMGSVLGERGAFPTIEGERATWDIILGDPLVSIPKNLEMHKGESRSLNFSIAEDLSGKTLAFTVEDSNGNILIHLTSTGGDIVISATGNPSTGYVNISRDDTIDLHYGIHSWGLFCPDDGDEGMYADGKFSILRPRASIT